MKLWKINLKKKQFVISRKLSYTERTSNKQLRNNSIFNKQLKKQITKRKSSTAGVGVLVESWAVKVRSGVRIPAKTKDFYTIFFLFFLQQLNTNEKCFSNSIFHHEKEKNSIQVYPNPNSLQIQGFIFFLVSKIFQTNLVS